MRTSRALPLSIVAFSVALALGGATLPAAAQTAGVLPSAAPATAADAALAMANSLDGAGGGISSRDLISALEDAALAGQPMALYQLGLMYESGEGVAKDPVKAFGYFSQIADEHADAAPKGVESDIVAQSFLKVGEYYRTGLPEAGIPKNEAYSNKLIMHAASYFGDADAQYKVGEMYLDDNELGDSPLQSARWLNLAARKGHAGAQAKLGSMLFNGEGIAADQVEGLMWLTVASRRAKGTGDEGWINDLLNDATSIATPEQRKRAFKLADSLGTRFGGL
ncbi:MAG: tetratricopeptide repeat protein [Devosia sp.]